MLLHTAFTVRHGFETVTLRTVDADVVVIAVAVVQRIAIKELRLECGTGQHLRYIPAHKDCYISWSR